MGVFFQPVYIGGVALNARRMTEISGALKYEGGPIGEFDEVLVRQLVSNIKVLDKDRILVRFKDGPEAEQMIGCSISASA